MSVSSEFKNVVENGSITAIRSYLANYLIGEDDFQLFDDALTYATSKTDVFQEHDGQEFSLDKTTWTNEYLGELLISVVTNFSKQRVEHIKDVVMETIIAPKKVTVSSASTNKQPATGQRTGRAVVSETIVSPPRAKTNQTRPNVHMRPAGQSHRPVPNNSLSSNANSKTGRRTISETEKPSDSSSDTKSHGSEYGAALIVGGAAVAAIGVVTVKPVVIGAGVAMAGTGAAIRASSKRK